MRGSVYWRGAAAAVAVIAASLPARALVITPAFESSITSDGNAAAIEAAINYAAGQIGALYSDPGTVKIVFNLGATALGSSTTEDYYSSYSYYVSLLHADSAANPGNTALATALANLSSGNDAAGAQNIYATSALFRVGLGASGVTPCFNSSGGLAVVGSTCVGSYDGVVTLGSTAPLDYNYGSPIVSGQYDAVSVLEHEIDEILGGGGQGSTLNQQTVSSSCANVTPAGYGPLDLYRYSAAGTPSYTTCGTTTSYFSINGGVTNLVNFNQNSTGDFADLGPSGYVQSAFGSTGVALEVTSSSVDVTMLASIGYDPVHTPEPAAIAMLASALGGLGLLRRRRRPAP